ncbi:MAG: hypothetical protein JJT75_06775 [Opitutales bacterium]|nr:hypothetical protein [Opitutales bacterium]MCH8541493.1 hypothetical protein [Opitutales bacterium]
MRAHENPFRAERLESLAFRWPESLNAERLLDKWHALNRRAALIAPKGHGKTTLLGTLMPHWEAEGWIIRRYVLREESPRFPQGYEHGEVRQWNRQTLLLLDGSEQLTPWSWWRWKRWSRQAGGVLITRHRPGGLPTLWQLETSPSLLTNLLAELWPGSLSDLPASPEKLWQQRKGDMRLIFRDLYDWAAQQEPS